MGEVAVDDRAAQRGYRIPIRCGTDGIARVAIEDHDLMPAFACDDLLGVCH